MKTKLCAIVLTLGLFTATGLSAPKVIWAKPFVGQKAPTLVVERWLTPEPNRKDKWTLIDFWATWCGPCREAIKELNVLHAKYGDRLIIIGLSDETEADVVKMKEPKIDYSVAIDTQARMKKQVEVTGIPHIILIDPSGIVRWEGFPLLGGYELTDQIVGDLLSGKPILDSQASGNPAR